MSTSGGTTGPSGPAGGDLSGTYPNPTVAQINGSPLGTTTGASPTNVLAWSGSAWAPAAGAAGTVRAATVKVATASTNISITTSNASSFTELAALTGGPGTGGMDLACQGVAGDIILICPMWNVFPGGTGQVCFDVKVTHSGNFISGGASNGVMAWAMQSNIRSGVTGPFFYTLVSGDIIASIATFRPMALTTITTGSGVFTTTASPFWFSIVNMTALATGS